MDEQTPRENKIIDVVLEKEMRKSFLDYSMSVIVSRALPDVRDGLKPVHRRILYTMHENNLTPDKAYRKCADTVGAVLGRYHPHGDASVYDAMVRMAQDFSLRYPLIDGHGNFGSIDGHPAAAYRYTEARMSKMSLDMLADIEKDTVDFVPNYDDRLKEPVVLPSRFPDLLVNGSSGIAVGMATNIPPHNLCEVVDAICLLIDDPEADLNAIMEHIKGPDFPTGGVIMGHAGIRAAYATGRGKITVRARTEIEEHGNRFRIVITEIPYQVNKAAMLVEIMKMVNEKKGPLTQISDIRDESDREGLRAVIEVKKDGDVDKILQYLYKYSNMQKTFGVNMVAIAEGKPKQMGLLEITKYYIEYQKEVERKRVRHDLDAARLREEILSGLMIAIQNIDRVIKIIRSSPNVRTAKEKLRQTFELSDRQATAILEMRLQRLTGLEIETLEKELKEVRALIAELEEILSSKAKLNSVIKKSLQDIKRRYKDARRTEILYGHTEQQVTAETFKVVEDVVVSVDRSGYIRRASVKNYNLSSKEAPVKAEDALVLVEQAQTDMDLLLFSSLGYCYRIKIEDIPDYKWREKGCAPGRLCQGFAENERIVLAVCYKNVLPETKVLFYTSRGMIKISPLSEYAVKKNKFNAITLKEGDTLINAELSEKEASVLYITRSGMSLNMDISDISVTGRVTAGVKGISLEEEDSVVFARQITEEGEIVVWSEKGYAKRSLAVDYELQMRARKGLKTFDFRKNGSNGTRIAGAVYVKEPVDVLAVHATGEVEVFNSENIFIEARLSAGKPYALAVMGDEIVEVLPLLL